MASVISTSAKTRSADASFSSSQTKMRNSCQVLGICIFLSTIVSSVVYFIYFVFQHDAASSAMGKDYQAPYDNNCLDETGIYMADKRLAIQIANSLHLPSSLKSKLFDQSNRKPWFSKVVSLLRHQKKGVFIDVGAGSSHFTHFLEDEYDWTGLLIDVDETTAKNLIESKRKSFISRDCVGQIAYSYYGIFEYTGASNRLVLPISKYARFVRKEMCYPLFSFMMALEITEFDLLIVDINGQELSVLQTLPYPEIFIKMIIIGYLNDEALNNTSRYLSKKGYTLSEIFDNKAVFVANNEKQIIRKKLEKFKNKQAAINQFFTFKM